jgi:hypothetical protein
MPRPGPGRGIPTLYGIHNRRICMPSILCLRPTSTDTESADIRVILSSAKCTPPVLLVMESARRRGRRRRRLQGGRRIGAGLHGGCRRCRRCDRRRQRGCLRGSVPGCRRPTLGRKPRSRTRTSLTEVLDSSICLPASAVKVIASTLSRNAPPGSCGSPPRGVSGVMAHITFKARGGFPACAGAGASRLRILPIPSAVQASSPGRRGTGWPHSVFLRI